MKLLKEKGLVVGELIGYECNKCGKHVMRDDKEESFEFQEVFHYEFVGGYNSVFGDGAMMSCSLCQHCLKEVLGKYCIEEMQPDAEFHLEKGRLPEQEFDADGVPQLGCPYCQVNGSNITTLRDKKWQYLCCNVECSHTGHKWEGKDR